MNSSISLDKALKNSVKEITKSLGCEVIGIERVVKIYGSNANSFILKTLDKNNRLKNYFLKFSRIDHIENELKGDLLLKNHLPTPKVILSSKRKDYGMEWALFEYLEGRLMSELFLDAELKNKTQEFIELEKEKERLLKEIHKIKKDISTKNYLSSKTNSLFYKRINGERFDLFYKDSPNNISKYFDKKIILNGTPFEQSINDIFTQIKKKYKSLNKDKSLPGILGHGDAHHGNIIVNGKIYFIDNEYAGYMPAFMELAKPYYNDLLGTLLFHYNDMLNNYFSIDSLHDNDTQLNIKISTPQKIKLRLLATETKLASRKNTINPQTQDFLSLSDYLIMCHTLTRDPNNYSDEAKYIYLVLTLILANFDPMNPDSLYKFF